MQNENYNSYVLVDRYPPGIIIEKPENIYYRTDKDIPININVFDDVKEIKCKVYFGDEVVEGECYRQKNLDGVLKQW